MEENLLDNIQKLGLNSYEAKVYLALLERNSLTVGDVSRLSQVPQARTYDILDKLVARGLANLKPGKYKKYSAADFESFRQKLKINNEKRYTEQSEMIENVTLTLKRKYEHTSNKFKADPLDYIEIIKDPFQIHKRFMQQCSEAKKEILVFTKPPYSGPRRKLEEQVDQQSDIFKKRIRGRCIYEIAKHEDEKKWQLEAIKRAVMVGEEARVFKDIPMKMAIFDSKTVMYTLEDPVSGQPSLTAQIIKHRALAKSLKMTFETLWEQAEDYHILEH